MIKNHIESFNPQINHYRREHAPNLRYLQRDLTLIKMYTLFNEQYPNCTWNGYGNSLHNVPKEDVNCFIDIIFFCVCLKSGVNSSKCWQRGCCTGVRWCCHYQDYGYTAKSMIASRRTLQNRSSLFIWRENLLHPRCCVHQRVVGRINPAISFSSIKYFRLTVQIAIKWTSCD